jgi:hypothetical protein
VQVVDMDLVLDGVEAEPVGLAMHEEGLHPGAGRTGAQSGTAMRLLVSPVERSDSRRWSEVR